MSRELPWWTTSADRATLFSLVSTDGCHWSLLQDCNPKLVAGASKVRGRFTGDPAHDYEGGHGPGAGPANSPTRSSPDEEAAASGVNGVFFFAEVVKARLSVLT